MHFDHQPTSPPFLAANCGAGLAPELPCLHGDPSFALRLFGTWHPTASQAGTELDVLLPRCVAAQLVGALTAFITHHEGHDAGEAFTDQAEEAFYTILDKLRDIAEQGCDCCEAAFRTGGREHTCRTEPEGAEQ